MPIKITSQRDGFRRCGVEHPARPTIYPNDRFTEEDLARLKVEPMLTVEKIPDEAAADPAETTAEESLSDGNRATQAPRTNRPRKPGQAGRTG